MWVDTGQATSTGFIVSVSASAGACSDWEKKMRHRDHAEAWLLLQVVPSISENTPCQGLCSKLAECRGWSRSGAKCYLLRRNGTALDQKVGPDIVTL